MTTKVSYGVTDLEQLDVTSSGDNTFLRVTSDVAAILRMKDTAGVTDEKVWDLINDGGDVIWRLVNDAGDAAAQVYVVTRNGNTVDYHDWFVGNNTQAMRLQNNGKVIIGATSGTGYLEVNQGTDLGESAPHFKINGSGYNGFHWLDSNAYYIGQNSASRSLRLYSSAETSGAQLSAGATSFTTFSDERLKENVEPIENAVQSLSGLRTVKYHLKDVDNPDDKKKIGLIAQDLVGVIDEVIDSTFRTDDETEYMGLRYTELIPVLVKAIQEQQDLIDSLTERVSALEANNASINTN